MPELSPEQLRKNRERAEAAKRGIKAWACGGYICSDEISDKEFEEEEDMILGDFLADLLHYFHQRGLDFWEYIGRGEMHFEIETTPEEEDEEEGQRDGSSEPPITAADHEAEMEQLTKDIVNIFCRPSRHTYQD